MITVMKIEPDGLIIGTKSRKSLPEETLDLESPGPGRRCEKIIHPSGVTYL